MTSSPTSAQLRTALNLSGNGVLLIDCLREATGRVSGFQITLVNQQAEKLTGLSEQAILDGALWMLLPKPIRVELWKYAKQVIETGESCETDLYVTLPNHASNEWIRITLQPYAVGLAASLQSITAQKQQAVLVETVLNGSINGMIAYEALRDEHGRLYDLRVLLANNAAVSITGNSFDQMQAQTVVERYPDIHKSGLFSRYAHTITTGEAQRFEDNYLYNNLNGWFDISISKLGDGLLMAFIDITHTKQYALKLQKSIDDLQRSNQNLERFAYVASHDLREPLRKIQSFGDLLRNQSPELLNEHSRELIERMQSAARRMNNLIVDLLTFSRLSAQVAPFQRVDLGQLLNDVLNDLETAIQEKRAVIDITSMPVVTGNPLQLQQVFQNLLSNALKFTWPVVDDKRAVSIIPTIRVDCQRVTGQEIVPLPGHMIDPLDLNRPFFAISVTDNGIGFDEKYLDRIFAVFQRLHGRNEYQGTGVGLAIVQKVMENHKGYVGAQSQPGQGAAFTVYLPDETTPAMPLIQ